MFLTAKARGALFAEIVDTVWDRYVRPTKERADRYYYDTDARIARIENRLLSLSDEIKSVAERLGATENLIPDTKARLSQTDASIREVANNQLDLYDKLTQVREIAEILQGVRASQKTKSTAKKAKKKTKPKGKTDVVLS